MHSGGTTFGRTITGRALALMACVALLYFAAGGSLFHQHTNGPDTACHICQALHMPALAAARLDFSSTPQIITWFSSQPQHAGPSDTLSLHRAGRAPPTA
jgi:predicted lipoprotein